MTLTERQYLEREIDQWEKDPASKRRQMIDRTKKVLAAVKPRCRNPLVRGDDCPVPEGRICMHKNLSDRVKSLETTDDKQLQAHMLTRLNDTLAEDRRYEEPQR